MSRVLLSLHFQTNKSKKGFTTITHCGDNEISFFISRFRKNPDVEDILPKVCNHRISPAEFEGKRRNQQETELPLSSFTWRRRMAHFSLSWQFAHFLFLTLIIIMNNFENIFQRGWIANVVQSRSAGGPDLAPPRPLRQDCPYFRISRKINIASSSSSPSYCNVVFGSLDNAVDVFDALPPCLAAPLPSLHWLCPTCFAFLLLWAHCTWQEQWCSSRASPQCIFYY